MNKVFNFIFGVLLGGLVGAGLALLLAPYSGNELRDELRARTAGFQANLNEAVASRRSELEYQLAQLRKSRPE